MNPNQISNQPIGIQEGMLASIGGFVSQVYGIMTMGLLMTTVVGILVSQNENWVYGLVDSGAFWVVLLAEVILVFALGLAINKMNTLVAAAMFGVYSLLNGLSIGIIVSVYDPRSVAAVLGVTAGTFMLMTFYGLLTKSDLTKFGNIALMGLVGVIIGFLVNILLRSDGLSYVLTFVSVGIFVVLIAVDTQKIKQFAAQAESTGQGYKYAIIAALELYLDFVNLFLNLLRILGRRD